MMNDLDSYIEEHRDEFEAELCELLRIASISTDGLHGEQLQQAAHWVAGQFKDLGLTVDLIDAGGSPIVYAETAPVPGAPTVLVYGHYDVQPPDPLAEWVTPPFEPTRRDGNLFARGATDDKGQMLTHVKSTEAWLKTRGSLPVQLKFAIEGEEEVGSDSLERYLAHDGAERLACDVVVVSDSSQFGPGQPAITYGLRGIACYELRLRGPKQDLHSGSFGGAVTNPANAVTRMMAALVDGKGRIQVPGFYDDVKPLTDREREQLAALPHDDETFQRRIGVRRLSGEDGYTSLERRWARPSFDINGLFGGYQDEGAKTVLPARAGVKFSFRLVPDQDPEKIATALRTRLEELCPPGIEMELIAMHGAPGVVVSLDSPFMTAASAAIERGFGRPPVFIREGGSIPIVNTFRDRLGVDTLLLGWGQDDDNAHSPNEKFSLADFQRGMKASAHLWEQISKISTAAS